MLDQMELLVTKYNALEEKKMDQKLQEREIAIKRDAKLLEFRKREKELEEIETRQRREAEELGLMAKTGDGLPTEELDSIQKTQIWMEKGATKKGKGRKISDRHKEDASTTYSSASKKHIAELEAKIKELQQSSARAAPEVDNKKGLDRLKAMGIAPHHLTTNSAAMAAEVPPTDRELQKMGLATAAVLDADNLGKEQNLLIHGCCEHGAGKKKQSGKYLKTNVNIKFQENWPHVNVLKKYAKRTTFDNMDYESFTAGETRVILQMAPNDLPSALGRLKFLSTVAHWMCASRDWANVRSLYEGVVESIELGEATWQDDFTHYEAMVTRLGGYTSKEMDKGADKVDRMDKKSKTDKFEVYWCKQFQKGLCSEKGIHLATIKTDEPPVPVMHICAHCYQKDNVRKDHPESECTSKKA